MLEAAVEAGVHAFLDGGEDGEIMERLERQGVEPWLAERLVVFLPIAFGRFVLRDCTFDPNFIDGQTSRPLASEPVYRLCAARAQRADRTEMEQIALRSAAVNAANQALNDGSSLSDLQFAAVRLTAPLPPHGDGDGGVPSPRMIVVASLREHGIAVDDSLQIGSTTLGGQMYPHEVSERGIIVQVDFTASDPRLAQPVLVESCAGFGRTWKEAIGSAVELFLRGSFHPLVAAMVDPSRWAEQLEWEDYEHPGGRFRLCLGPQLDMFDGQAYVGGPLLDDLLVALRGRTLTPQIHWLRLFSNMHNGQATISEALLDNQTWPEGEEILARHATGEGFRASRIFMMMVPGDSGAR